MVPGKAAKPWTLQGHPAEPAEHWLSWAGGGRWQKGREKVTSSLARPKGWQGGGCRGTPIACPVPPWPRLALPLELGDGASPASHVPNSKPHPQQLEKRPREAFPPPVLGGAGRDGAPQGHCHPHHPPPAMALHPRAPTLVPAQPCPSRELRAGMVMLRSGGFGSLRAPLLAAPLVPTPDSPQAMTGDVMEKNQLT